MTATPGLDALAELTGTDRDELLRHPPLLLTALATAGNAVVNTALGLVDEDPDARAAATARREHIVEVLTRRPAERSTQSRLLHLLDQATAAVREANRRATNDHQART
jgi:hypothetical protein